MNLNNGVKLTGQLTIKKFDAAGHLTAVHEHNNLVVTTGKVYIASRMAGEDSDVMSHMLVGTGNTAAAVSDVGLEITAGTTALSSTSAVSNTITYTATFSAGQGTGALAEAGIFNAAAGGVMLCRTVFPVVNKSDTDTISITWVVTVS